MTRPDDTEPSAEALEAALPVALVICGQKPDMSREDTVYWLSVPEQDKIKRARNSIALALDRFRAAGVREWQPIETAPRDGSPFDVWLGDANASDIEFYCTPGTRRSCGWHWLRDKFRPCIGGLQMPTFVVPTHWMPLPEPPHDL